MADNATRAARFVANNWVKFCNFIFYNPGLTTPGPFALRTNEVRCDSGQTADQIDHPVVEHVNGTSSSSGPASARSFGKPESRR